METLFVAVCSAIAFAIRLAYKRWLSGPGIESLCLTCVNAAVTRGTRGQVMVACNLAGAMRPVKFTVCQCTAFCVRGGPAKLVTIEGFAPDKRKVYAEVAIS